MEPENRLAAQAASARSKYSVEFDSLLSHKTLGSLPAKGSEARGYVKLVMPSVFALEEEAAAIH